ncbi:uncharacterized protein N7479_004036 [Penicillium vulpinum]|uniref:uncharacterized protein n=1 Tax=Penicillium vulpinum TaxID=29845 RepID=UPI00254814FC|nr:uncharacterized protein N7479_004036 [Penicillium vulpinum]KAJ5964160.1 hypothetical protein N7479_004036 [Penicillium vulpinum]
MSDLFRRASDAFHHRRNSTDSTDASKSLDPSSAANPPEQESLNQNSESAQPESHVNEASAGTMLHLRNNTTFGDGHTTRQSNPGQSSNLARSRKILNGLLARRRIIVLDRVAGVLTLSL